MKNLKSYYLLLSVINFLAILVAAYLTYMHFAPELTDVCNLSEKWNCEIVNKSIYSEIFGIPVAILGLIAYLAFFVFSIRGFWRDQSKWLPYFLFFVAGGTAFALYLTGIEAFVLRTFCLFCVTQQVLILIELGLAVRLTLLTRKHA